MNQRAFKLCLFPILSARISINTLAFKHTPISQKASHLFLLKNQLRTKQRTLVSSSPIATFNTIASKTSLNMSGLSEAESAKEKRKTQFPHINSRDVESVRNAPKMDGKRPDKVSNGTFLITAVVGVPLWLTVIMPLTVVYQAGKKLLPSSPEEEKKIEEIMSEETFPAVEDLKPQKDRKYDVVLLGCTGFTGRLAAIYIAKTYPDLSWALAGRSQAKLDKLKKELEDMNLSDMDVSKIDTLIVDTAKPNTLHKLADDTKTVITTAGPFWKYGSNVVEFCAKYGTNYVDITGETDWNKYMIMKWDKTAEETGAKIISLCGHDCIPWDLTCHKLAQVMKEECDDSIKEVRCYDDLRGGISGGTVDTMLGFIEGNNKTPRFDFDPYYKKRDGSKSNSRAKNVSSQIMGQTHENDFEEKKWTVPFFMTAVNAEVVKNSHAHSEYVTDGEKITYSESAVQPGFKEAFVKFFGAAIGFTAMMNPITLKPMKKILPKPGEGPSKKSLEYGYLLVSGVGEGVKGSKVETELYFPKDAGYKDTARMVVEAGLCLALDSDKLPVQGGGFFTPAIGMGDALLERLCKTGSKFASRVVKVQGGNLKSKL